MIKAIETRYRGYNFRSRLEARWAVFFDELGIKWRYEVEGYDLGELGNYLPDFSVSAPLGRTLLLEVKGDPVYRKSRNVYLAGAMMPSQGDHMEWRPSHVKMDAHEYKRGEFSNHYYPAFGGYRHIGPFGIDEVGGHGYGGHVDITFGTEDLAEIPSDDDFTVYEPSDEVKEMYDMVHAGALKQIRSCDLFFAWLDSMERYGTIAEIGYAKGLGKEIWIGTPKRNSIGPLWFALDMADKVQEAPTARDAFEMMDIPLTIEEQKCLALSRVTNGEVILLSGDPGVNTHYANSYVKGDVHISGGNLDMSKHGLVVLPREWTFRDTVHKISSAHNAARSARFEHGQNGAT